MKKSDLLLYLGFLLIVISFMLLLYNSFLEKDGTCTADPIKYGVEQIRFDNQAEYVFGRITYISESNSKTWEFGDVIGLNGS